MTRHARFLSEGKPFFPFGAQAHNSSSYSLDQTRHALRCVKALNGNSLAITICWDRFEPEEGRFDRQYITDIIDAAREEDLRLIMLWFGSWKNGIMGYCPSWVKLDTRRFRRVRSSDGREVFNLSCHCPENYRADGRAFAALCQTVKAYDPDCRTVIGFQVQNEPGQWPGARRDFCAEATKAFEEEVPAGLISYIKSHPQGPTYPYWAKRKADAGNWKAVFGRFAPEAFSAYTVASYINYVAGEGKKQHDVPMYINVALDGGAKGEDFEVPGLSYFTGSPVPKVRDIFYYVCENLDMLCPDDYKMEITRHKEMLDTYANPELGWPLYVPESGKHALNTAHMMYAVGELGAVGYHVFGAESLADANGVPRPDACGVANSFAMLTGFAPLLSAFSGKKSLRAMYQYPGETGRLLELDGWKCYVSYIGLKSYNWGNVGSDYRHPEVAEQFGRNVMDYNAEKGRGLLLQAGPDEFYLVGHGIHLFFNEYETEDGDIPNTLLNPTLQITTTEYIDVTEGHFDQDGKYVVDVVRSGDESWRGVWAQADCGVIRFTLRRREG